MQTKHYVDISESDLKAISTVLGQVVPDRPAFLFGSRVTGLARPESDLDIALGGFSPLTLGERGSLQDALEELGLGFKVDVIDLQDARGLFRQRIEAEWIPCEQAEASHAEAAA